MEQIKEMTAQESLKLITETLNSSRRSILRNNSKGFILWGVFGAFSLLFSALAIFVVPMPITFTIVLLLGIAESISGVILKNWPIIIGGFVIGIGGAVAATLLKTEAQLLLFTLGGVVLAVTGLIVRYQYK